MNQATETGKIKLLLDNVDDRAKAFHKDVKRFRSKYRFFAVTLVLVSALVTVLTAVNSVFSNSIVPLIVVALGSIGTVLGAIQATYSPRDTWLLYYISHTRLKALQTELAYKLAEPRTLSSEAVDYLFERYQEILESHAMSFAEVRRGKRDMPNKAISADAKSRAAE